MAKKLYLSASRVKNFLDCSWQFYHNYILKVPETTHPKTKLGTLTHLILEVLQNPRHKPHLDKIVKTRDVYSSAPVSRLIDNFLKKNPDITEEIYKELNKLVFTALDHDYFSKGAKEVLPPEFPFEIDFDGFSIKGFIDKLAIYDNHAIITDYKTQGKKFTKKELEDNIQALFYQLAVDKIFKLPSRVDFILLRYPPTSINKTNHLQTVAAVKNGILNGFKIWLKEINKEITGLNKDNCHNNLKACKDIGFCNRVCKLRDPFDYYVLLDKDGMIITSSRDEISKIEKGQKVEKRAYNGCYFFYNEKGGKRKLEFST